MLYLQRASAGSGKTYSLARTYLKLLLGIRRTDGSYRLREPAETRDAHSRLLAITFTNKATAEMSKRFIDKLAALAETTDADKTDYMRDFMEEFKAPQNQIQRIAKLTLSAILNHYSDFQVSTIDSFFQQILHSFAYEAELPDNYAVELDTNMVIAYALDSLFASAQANPTGEERYWLNIYMKKRQQKGVRWNISQRGRGSAYRHLFGYLKMIDKESFKQQRENLEAFLQETGNLRPLYLEAQKTGQIYIADTFTDALSAANELTQAIDELAPKPKDVSRYISDRLEKIKSAHADRCPFSTAVKPLSKILNAAAQKRFGAETELRLKDMEMALCEKINCWVSAKGYVDMVADAIPVIALIGSLLKFIQDYRTENNIVQLSDTNTILRTITEGTDVPFIYEKIGTRLDSYMIDEFQDTSAMQWYNMRPLVEESLSEGNDNLIIGDAKQSIYRFRNADSSLITKVLPQQFSGAQLTVAGATPAENANWRSAPQVVRFNNSLFSYLTHRLDPDCTNGDIAATYSGVLQKVMQKSLHGYVEISQPSADKPDEVGNMYYLGDAVASLLARGYRMKDIAVLVRTNVQGQDAVKALVNYNGLHKEDPGFAPIDFISDESLLISRAKSVEITVAMLEAVKGETTGNVKIITDADYAYSLRTDDLNAAVHRMRAANPQIETDALLELYFQGEYSGSQAETLLKDAPSTALPALVEHIIALYVPKKLRDAEAQYLCAFQDAVARYCETHQCDVASFLHWWNDKQRSLCVTSPEDADAINILTIHKSKGLEWRCVLVPDCSLPLTVSANEQKWLTPRTPFDKIMPPLLPVNLNARKNFMFTPYEADYREVERQTQLDALNVAYVAFTRAVDELYIYLTPDEKSESLARLIKEVAASPEKLQASENSGIDSDYYVASSEITTGAPGSGMPLLTIGEKPTEDYVIARNTSLAPANEAATTLLNGYDINSDSPRLTYVMEDDLEAADDDPLSTTRSRRRLGSVKHAVMEGIRPGHPVEKEIDRMLLRSVVRGKMSESEVGMIRDELLKALELPEARRWFAPEMRVYSERTIFDGMKGDDRRPDRIVVDAEGTATVIEYKFGKPLAAYPRQVKRYMELLRRTGLFRTVRGAVWYLAEGTVQTVE